MSSDPSRHLESIGLLLEMLVQGGVSKTEVKRRTGLSHEYVVNLFKVLERRQLIHCNGLNKDRLGRANIVLFKFGPDPEPGKFKRRRAVPDRKVVRTVWQGFVPADQPKPKSRRRPLAVIPEAVREIATAE